MRPTPGIECLVLAISFVTCRKRYMVNYDTYSGTKLYSNLGKNHFHLGLNTS